MALHKDLLDVLVCPGCKGELRPVAGQGEAAGQGAAAGLVGLDCVRCGLRFPIVDDIPVMLLDQAERLPASN